MPFSYTTSDLITSIKGRGDVPTSQNTFQNSDFLRFATEVIHSSIVPMLLAAQEGYYDYNIDQSFVSGQQNYAIPTRAIGAGGYDVQSISEGGTIFQIPYVERTAVISNVATSYQFFRGTWSYYVEGNDIVVTPAPAVTDQTSTLRIVIRLRPGKLVETSSCAQISSINTGTNTITVSSIPSTWSTGTVLDLLQQTPHYRYKAIDQTSTLISGTSITFASLPSAPNTLAVGDWVALQGESPVIQVPHEMIPLVSEMTVYQVLKAKGDQAGMKVSQENIERMKKDAMVLIEPRFKASTKKIVNRNRFDLSQRYW